LKEKMAALETATLSLSKQESSLEELKQVIKRPPNATAYEVISV
jgi:hypothetical protein